MNNCNKVKIVSKTKGPFKCNKLLDSAESQIQR